MLIPEMVMVIILMIRASTTMDPEHNRLLVNQRLHEMKTALEPVCFEDFDTCGYYTYLYRFLFKVEPQNTK